MSLTAIRPVIAPDGTLLVQWIVQTGDQVDVVILDKTLVRHANRVGEGQTTWRSEDHDEALQRAIAEAKKYAQQIKQAAEERAGRMFEWGQDV